jgi:hypothetical protein
MTDDELMARILARASGAPSLAPVATMGDLADAERRLGFALPSFYRRLLLEVGNGGFGPGYGLIGVPPNGFVDDDLGASNIDVYDLGRAESDDRYREAFGALFLLRHPLSCSCAIGAVGSSRSSIACPARAAC